MPPTDGTSAYLFLGANATFNGSGLRWKLDMGSIPSSAIAYNASGWTISGQSSAAIPAPPLASILECSPNFSIFTSWISIDQSSNTIITTNSSSSQIPAIVSNYSHSSLPRVNNISPASAAFLLYDCLRAAITKQDQYGILFALNTVASRLFLTNEITDGNANQALGVRSAHDISASLGTYYSSCAKGYADGYLPGASAPVTTQVNTTVWVARLSLVGSKVFTPLAGFLAGAILVMAAIQLRLKVRDPFDLKHVRKVVLEDEIKRKST